MSATTPQGAMSASVPSRAAETYHFNSVLATAFEPYIPSRTAADAHSTAPAAPAAPVAPPAPARPFVTLTFTTSLDSALTLTPGRPTQLSGPETMGMTHFLRSRHAAILVGAGAFLADNPSLNCRLAGEGTRPPRLRPVVLDPDSRWDMDPGVAKVLRLAAEGLALAPYVVSRRRPDGEHAAGFQALGGKVIVLPSREEKTEGEKGMDGGEKTKVRHRFRWADVFAALAAEGLSSVMVEGGGDVVNALLGPEGEGLVDSVIVTIAPKWLGRGSLLVGPERRHDAAGTAVPAASLTHVAWHPLGSDVVLCGKPAPR